MKKLILIFLFPVFLYSQHSTYKKTLCENSIAFILEEKYETPIFKVYSSDDILVISANSKIEVSSTQLAKQTETLQLILNKTKRNNFQYFSDFSNRNIFNDVLKEYKYIFFRTNYITTNLETISINFLFSFENYMIIKDNLNEKRFTEILEFIKN